MAIVAVMLVAGFSAFKIGESQKTYQDDLPEDFIPWYYTGDDEDDVNDPTKYSKTPTHDCDGDDVICEIYAPEDENTIPLIPNLEAQIDPQNTASDTVEDLILEAMTSKTTNDVVRSFKPL